MSSVYDALTKAAKTAGPVIPHEERSKATTVGWKIMTFVLVLLFLLVLHQLVSQLLRRHLDENARLITTNFSDAAATYLASKDVLHLDATIGKYSRLPKVAYVFIQDRHGTVIAHSWGVFPSEVRQGLTFDQNREINRRELTLEGKTVYETSAPILEGQLGRAHVAIWGAAVEEEIYRGLFLFVWPLTFSIVGSVVMASFIGHALIRRLQPRVTNLRLSPRAIAAGKDSQM